MTPTPTPLELKQAIVCMTNYITALALTVYENRPCMCPRGAAFLAYQEKGVSLNIFTQMEDALVATKLVHRTSEYLVWIGPDNWRTPPLFQVDDNGKLTTQPWAEAQALAQDLDLDTRVE